MSAPAPSRVPIWRRRLVVYGSGLAFLLFAAFGLIQVVLRVPSRVNEINLAGQRLRVALVLEPDPPRIGAIMVQVTITDESGTPVRVDELALASGSAGRTGSAASAAPLASDGLYRGRVDFAEVGKAWVEVKIRRGDFWGRVRFPVEVRPNM